MAKHGKKPSEPKEKDPLNNCILVTVLKFACNNGQGMFISFSEDYVTDWIVNF